MIQELTQEAHEIIFNIREAARQGNITWGQRDELIGIVMKDVADKAGLLKASELLMAWQRPEMN